VAGFYHPLLVADSSSSFQPIIIRGGGIAGLWTRFALEQAGYVTRLYELAALGAGQTIASQGILHRGVKYALSARAGEASRALASAQSIWEEALAGRGGPDLRAVRTLTTRMHLWTTPGMLGGLTGAAAALAMKSGVRKLEMSDVPPIFAGAPKGTCVWEVEERCIETASLIGALRDSAKGEIVCGADPSMAASALKADSNAVTVLAAGLGNEGLLRELGHNPQALCQRRPLHMVLARHAPFDLFAHCLRTLSDKPRLTITTAREGEDRIWYIGGDISETGVERTENEQIAAAIAELQACAPWIELRGMEWAAFRIDRAEGKTVDGTRPDGPVMHVMGNTIAIWPTKLALAPAAAAMVVGRVAKLAAPGRSMVGEHSDAPAPISRSPWELSDEGWRAITDASGKGAA